MGVFSWITSDSKISVPNDMIGQPPSRPVKMLDDKGNVYYEPSYGGYGCFGGVDYYTLLANMNGTPGTTEEVRANAIKMVHTDKKKCKKPKIVEADCTIPYDELPDSKDCPHQGHFYDEKTKRKVAIFTMKKQGMIAKAKKEKS